jgi:DNA-binding transcriptional LysR family regulator
VDLGSFAAASHRLHLAPPTVSLHISELEARLGTALLLRTRKSVVPTSIGETLIARARRLLAAADEAMEEVERQLHGGMGRVRVGASTGVLAHLLPTALETLAQEHGRIDVQVAVLTSQSALEQLRQGSLDIGLIALPQPSAPGLNVLAWRRDPVMAFVPTVWLKPSQHGNPKKAEIQSPKHATPSWLAERALILNDSSTRLHKMTMEWFAAAGLTPTPRIELNYNDAMKSLVAAGYGAALLPVEAESAGADMTDRRTTIMPLMPKLWRPLGLAYRTGALEPATQAVLDVLIRLGPNHASKVTSEKAKIRKKS